MGFPIVQARERHIGNILSKKLAQRLPPIADLVLQLSLWRHHLPYPLIVPLIALPCVSFYLGPAFCMEEAEMNLEDSIAGANAENVPQEEEDDSLNRGESSVDALRQVAGPPRVEIPLYDDDLGIGICFDQLVGKGA